MAATMDRGARLEALARATGGSRERVHGDKTLKRPEFLKFCPERARFATVETDRRRGNGAGHKIFYEVWGHGPTRLVLIMGLGTTHVHFEPLLKWFGIDRENEYSVLLLDNRACGFSEVPGGRYTTSLMADDAAQVLEQEGWTSGVHVLGCSMGGMITQELVLAKPWWFASMTLVVTHAGGLCSSGDPRLLPVLMRPGGLNSADSVDNTLDILFPPHYLSQPHDAEVEIENDAEVGLVSIPDKRMLHAWALILRSRKYREHKDHPTDAGVRESTILRQFPAVVTHYVGWDRLAHLRSFGLPTLVVGAEHDLLIRPVNSAVLARALDATHLHFSDAGHAVMEQHSREICEEVEQVVKRGAAATAVALPPAKRRAMPPTTHPWRTGALLALLILALVRAAPRARRRTVALLAAWASAALLRFRHGGLLRP